MVDLILKCGKCGNYSMEKKCKCGRETLNTKPPKFSLEDKYAEYRLKYKKEHSKIED